MKNYFLMFLLFAGIANAQIKVGSNPTVINPASILELESTSKGFLPPRMLYAQKILIPNPPAGLIIWCIDCATLGELQVFNGTEWTNLVGDIASGIFSIPVLTTTTVSNITSTTASSGGTVTNNGGKTITALGVCWGITSLPTIGSSKTIDSGTIGTFTSAITGLNPFTDYFVRAYATNAIGTAYGNELTFKTQVGLSSVNTDIASSITATTATSGGNVISDGGSTISERGICWSLGASPTIADGKLTSSGTTGAFISNLSGLIPASLYHARAYATNANGTAYGNEITFTTVAGLPLVSTAAITSVGSNSATSGGNVSSDGGVAITARGICWGTTATPTTSNSIITDSATSTGIFVSNLSGLNAGTTYYLRAFAINTFGTAYGNELNFTTAAGLSSITTDNAIAITSTTATSGGNVISDGGSTISERGICWSLGASPTIADGKLTSSGTTGTFISNLTGLIPVTTYYVRAYAINTDGTAYGNEISFTTVTGLPLVSTAAITSVGSTSATSGGNVSSDGGVTITARGICWGTTVNPTTADSKITDATTTIGTFISNLSGLNLATTYHVRAYVINSFGTAYGADLTFTTDAVTPVIGGPYQGGTIGYIFQPGDPGYVAGETHGVVVAAIDQSTDISWIIDGPTAITAPITSVDLGSGSTNTNLILAATDTTAPFAAQIARAYTSGGYSDWSLPSKNELEKIFENHVVLGLADDQYYWTSSTDLTPAGDLTAYIVRSYLYVDSNGDPLYYDSNGNPQPYIQSDASTVYLDPPFQAYVRAIRLF